MLNLAVDLRHLRRRARHTAWQLAEPPPFLPPVAVQPLKIAIASGLAWGIGQALHSPQPFSAVLAVIILMQGHAYSSLLNAVHFVIGVAVGLIIGIVTYHVIGISPLLLAALVFVCMLIGDGLRFSRHSNQIAVSALLVLASGSSENVQRLWETALGGAVGVAVAALMWPPNPIRALRQSYHDMRGRITADVLRTGRVAGGRGDAEANRHQIRENSERADRAVAEVRAAEEALRWNPWHSGSVYDLGAVEDRLRLISYLYRTVRAFARQAVEAPPHEGDHERDWARSHGHLEAATAAAAEAIEHRLDGQPSSQAVTAARQAAARFAASAPRDSHALALAAALEDLVSDIENWRPPYRVVNPDRRLAARARRARSRVAARAARPVRERSREGRGRRSATPGGPDPDHTDG